MKRCNGPCDQVKEDSKFYVKRYANGTVGLRATCISCGTQARDIWRLENFEHDNARNLEYNKRNAKRIRGEKLRVSYWPDLSWQQALDKYEEYRVAQNGLCAICNCQETRKNPNGTPRDLAVDHCHKSGRVRGLLCNRCNRGIGLLKEDHGLLLRAVTYLADELLTGDVKAFTVKLGRK